jgi:hypothetical protein
MTPGDRVTQLYPRHWVPILAAFYDMHGLQWDYSLIPATTRTYGHDTYVQFGLTYVLHPEPLIATKMQTFYGSLCKINHI